MIYATKIHMRPGCKNSWYLTEIDSIYLEGLDRPGFYSKEDVHNFLKVYPGKIKVKIKPFPDVIPAVSIRKEKYVKSEPNEYGHDNLLCLPRT